MLKAMMFVDHQNFTLALKNYYKSTGEESPKLDYTKFPDKIVKKISRFYNKSILLKMFLFSPKPDDFLGEIDFYKKYYDWTQNLNKIPYIDVVEGRWVSRPSKVKTSTGYVFAKKDKNDESTYNVFEKGTDLNLAVHALSKAYNNSYDIAIIVSGDTDYISLYHQLRAIGKIVIVVLIENQNKNMIQLEVDEVISLDKTFFQDCIKYKTKN